MALANVTPASGKLTFSPTLARGLGYYTGPIFEIAHPEMPWSLGGGGRYDGLIGSFLGRNVSACGFSLGLERLLVVMEERSMFPELGSDAEVLVGYVNKDQQSEALRLAYTLRSAGRRVELCPKAEKPGKLRKQTVERQFRWLAFYAADGQIEAFNPQSPDDTHKSLSMAQIKSLVIK